MTRIYSVVWTADLPGNRVFTPTGSVEIDTLGNPVINPSGNTLDYNIDRSYVAAIPPPGH
jgi:hypothetical protein